jgi:dihydropteroate synthase
MLSLERPAPQTLRCVDRDLRLDRCLVMGILNVTPDSFSDGGRFLAAGAALSRARHMVTDGADILDIGGESTRPGAPAVSLDEELERVIPVIEAIAKELPQPISIDTRKAEVARRAIAAGACLVNDVSAGADPDMFAVAARTGAAMVLMHTRGASSTMMDRCHYDDVVTEVRDALAERVEAARAAGVSELIIDPGLGFAKLPAQNYELLKKLDAFTELGLPLLLGPSRKRFIGELTGQPAAQRVEGTIAACLLSALHGAHIVRVHDVAAVKRSLMLLEAVRDA